jgi:glycosyltransferase involved in cell wall biosynthesis
MVVSIVTPSYNQGVFLAQTIESVISQEGSFAIDYIIMDGNSTDDSVAIIKRYQKLLESGEWPVKCLGISFRWSSQRDNGQADAIKTGFLQAQGTIMAWINSDDFYMPGAFQAVCDVFQANQDVSLLYGDADYCDVHGDYIGRYPAAAFNIKRLAYFNFIPQPSTFFRKEAYEAVGGMDDSLRFVMDFDLACRICKQFNCHYLPRQLSCYRLHDAAKTVREEGLFDNHDEALKVVMKHFDWAPFNLVYGSCAGYVSLKLSDRMKQEKMLFIIISLASAMFRSLWLNRGIDFRDFQLLNRGNFRKLFKSRRENLLG